MSGLQRTLKARGYRVINVNYPSTRISIAQAADECLGRAMRERMRDPKVRVHFVTHSMGGIVLRQYLTTHRVQNLGRVIMLGPPNHGSPLANRLKRNFFYKLLTGPAGQELGTDSNSVPSKLGPASFDLGIIAGDRSIQPFFSSSFRGSNDGIVEVEGTRLKGMRAWMLVHHSHFFLPWARDVRMAVTNFLEHGWFLRAGPCPQPNLALR